MSTLARCDGVAGSGQPGRLGTAFSRNSHKSNYWKLPKFAVPEVSRLSRAHYLATARSIWSASTLSLLDRSSAMNCCVRWTIFGFFGFGARCPQFCSALLGRLDLLGQHRRSGPHRSAARPSVSSATRSAKTSWPCSCTSGLHPVVAELLTLPRQHENGENCVRRHLLSKWRDIIRLTVNSGRKTHE
jgi:hypothetical protein